MMLIEMPFHPLIVHFPIGFLVLSGIMYLLSIFVRKDYLMKAGLLALVLGALAAGAAVITGDMAEDLAKPRGVAHEMVEDHELFGLICAWAFGILAVWGIFRQKRFIQVEKIAFVVLLLACVSMLLATGHLGGKMVFEQGVGAVQDSAKESASANAGVDEVDED